MKQQVLIAGRYRLNNTIGRGAMGEVWQAYDELVGRPVAVKLLHAQNSEPTAAARFRLEAQTAGLLSHPHVVGVLDFGEQEGRLFLVMELVDGDSLARVLAQTGPLPAEDVARIAAQSAAGLGAAHEQGIVHRDIKPGNLLLDADGSLKIGDFGIAHFMNDPSGALTATGQIVGTSLYIAPERALGQPAGPPSDVYSLGCVLYQLLTGQPPFRAGSPIAVLHHHLDTAPVPPANSASPSRRPSRTIYSDSWRRDPRTALRRTRWPSGSRRATGADAPSRSRRSRHTLGRNRSRPPGTRRRHPRRPRLPAPRPSTPSRPPPAAPRPTAQDADSQREFAASHGSGRGRWAR